MGNDHLILPEPREWTLDIETGQAVINKNAPAMTLPAAGGRGGRGRASAPATTTTSPASMAGR